MRILKLTDAFFQENTHLLEVMDKAKGVWASEKKRGYGIVVIEHNNLQFGIPLRSNLQHNSGFKTLDNKGLDYSKAVLLTKPAYVSNVAFQIPSDEYTKIQDRSNHIERQFDKYVEKYIKGYTNCDSNILRHYRFSTLQNYHTDLGITNTCPPA